MIRTKGKYPLLGLGILLTILSFLIAMNTYAQTREFTLEDLNFGGTNYHRMTPENRFLSWWGDELVRVDVEECFLVDKITGEETKMFSLDELNLMAGLEDSVKIRSLLDASFPYEESPFVLVEAKNERLLLDFKEGKIVFRQTRKDETHEDFCPISKAVAFVDNDNLFVRDKENRKRQLTFDGSHDIVYGQSVHREEFGIFKGTFWSPSGELLAFYRMDQSMVTDYPIVDISKEIATEVPTKYPMAGKTSHKVTIGVYDLKKEN
ncbi:MAG: DPP IV N-terminal domain-containing protein, partial [Prevotella sp.]|nr:DPP IV N-terminal domain-containing protein [Prevotella sp.]